MLALPLLLSRRLRSGSSRGKRFLGIFVLMSAFGATGSFASAAEPVLKILFLGDNGVHKPAERMRSFAPVMMNRGIQIVYTEDLAALTLENLQRYGPSPLH